MSTLINLSVEVSKLPKERFKKAANGKVYCDFTLSVDDKTNDYGQNVSMFIPQTEEERAAGKKREFLGNGKVFWTSGTVSLAERVEKTAAPAVAPAAVEADFPF